MKAMGSRTRPDDALRPERSTWSHVPEEKLIIYESSVQASTLQRKFFITQKGFMGTGPPETSPGDKVVALFGGRYHSCFANKLIQQTSLVAVITLPLFRKVMRTRLFSGHCSGIAMSVVLWMERLLITGTVAIEGIGCGELSDKDAFLAKHIFLLAFLNFIKDP
jgi:hypothetical protein